MIKKKQNIQLLVNNILYVVEQTLLLSSINIVFLHLYIFITEDSKTIMILKNKITVFLRASPSKRS